MTKIKLKDATAQLIQNSGSILKQASKMRKNADNLALAIDKIEKSFIIAENERIKQEKLLEQQKLVDSHMSAFTMSDYKDVEPVSEAASKVAEKLKEKAEQKLEKDVEEVKIEVLDTKPEEPVIEKAKQETKAINKPAIKEEPKREFNRNAQNRAPYNNNTPYVAQRKVNTPNNRTDFNTSGVNNTDRTRRPYNNANSNFANSAGGTNANTARGFNRGYTDNRNFGGDSRPTFNRNDKPSFRPNTMPYNKDKDEDDDNTNIYKRKSSQSSGRGAKTSKAMDLGPIVEKEKVSNYDPNKKNYERKTTDYENANRKKKVKVKNTYLDEEFDSVRGRRSAKKKVSVQQMMDPIQIDKAVMTAETITVRDLSAKTGKQANEILKKLLILGIMANINSELDFDTASIVTGELGVELELKMEKSAEDRLSDVDTEDDEESMEPRPPVVTIMGHVDHGKTSLLDFIRNSHVTSGEAGGITQHIGAYMVDLDGKPITFLDTPGHEAFTSMRARGAQATDIAIIVVAANDGVMPQTVEAINHAKAADVPIIIAINKMDLESANPERVKQELTNYELVSEDWGGDTIMVPISATTGKGIEQLLEMILIVSEMQQLKANPNRKAKGVIIEAKLDKSRGPLATVLLKAGTLKIGDSIVAGTASGHVRAMLNDKGQNVISAGPSMPVEISGFDEVPAAGDEMMSVDDSRLGKNVAAERRDKEKVLKQSAGNKVTLENLFSKIDQGKLMKLNLIIKADVQGSVEAVKQALEKLSNDEVKVRVLHSAVGAITNDDVNLASAFNAIIIGFNIRPNANAKEIAAKEGVDIRLYRVIYKAIEDIEKAMKGMLDPEFKEILLGHAEVRNTFHITGIGIVAGCYVTDGKMQRKASVRLLRDNVVVFEGKLSSLKRFKDDAKEVASNYECGISLDGFNDIKINDIIECFTEEEIER